MGRVPFRWIAISIAVGLLIGPAVLLSDPELRILVGLGGLIGFGVLAFVRPLLAVQVLVFLIVSGLSNQGSATSLGTSYTAGHLLTATLFGAWLISGRGLRASRTGRFGAWIFVIVALWLAFAFYGVTEGYPWGFIQLDVVPAVFLLAFFPIVDVLRDEDAVRSVLRAVVAGLVVMSLGLVYEYLLHYDAPRGNFLTTWGKVYGAEGPAGGPKVIPFAGQWIPAGLLAGFLWMQRGDVKGGPLGGLTFAGLMGVALLLTYTRSLMALTVFSIVLMGLVMARQPKRSLSMAAGVVAVVAVLAVAIPMLGGGSAGEVVDGIRSRFTNLTEDPSWEFRRAESAAGYEVFGDHPFVGAGLGVIVPVPELENDGRPPSNHFHNAYVGLLAKTGIVGTGVFVAFLLSLIVRGLRRGLAGSGRTRFVLIAGGSGLVGISIASYSSDYLQVVSGMFYLALFAALVSSQEARDAPAEAPRWRERSALRLDEGDPRVAADRREPAEGAGVRRR
jgi:O-antigen ligase